jgi:FixJ family two-component response regulator
MDGLETLRALKSIRADVPVIMLSGHGAMDAAEEGMKYGAVEYLLKPCNINTLCDAIKRRADA